MLDLMLLLSQIGCEVRDEFYVIAEDGTRFDDGEIAEGSLALPDRCFSALASIVAQSQGTLQRIDWPLPS